MVLGKVSEFFNQASKIVIVLKYFCCVNVINARSVL